MTADVAIENLVSIAVVHLSRDPPFLDYAVTLGKIPLRRAVSGSSKWDIPVHVTLTRRCRMTRAINPLALFVAQFALGWSAVAADIPPQLLGGKIDWVYSYDEGRQLARANGKPLFVVFRCER